MESCAESERVAETLERRFSTHDGDSISALEHIFNASHELAASCGILLWVVTFVSVVPVGLLLAHRERLSLRKLSEESEQEEASAELTPSPPAA
jgi:hypothetical protein